MGGHEPLLARCSFPPAGEHLHCAVSGGPDSMALMVLAVEAGCEVTAIHVDHGLREGSATEADVVAEAARRFGAGFRSESVDVAPGPNLEERARQARWSVLPAGAATGHTADDQAETVLLNLLRGAGLAGVAGMRPGTRHPILGLRRFETEQVCADADIEPVRDPTNEARTQRRNRVRHEVLPLLDDVAERDVVPLLARHARHAREALEALEALAAEAVADPADCRSLTGAPEVLASLAVREWVRRESGSVHPPDAASVERVLSVARGEIRATELNGGWRVARSERRLRLEPPAGRPPQES